MKIAFTTKNISPEVGVRIAGYGPDDFTVAKHDDLYLSVLALNDGKNTCAHFCRMILMYLLSMPSRS